MNRNLLHRLEKEAISQLRGDSQRHGTLAMEAAQKMSRSRQKAKTSRVICHHLLKMLSAEAGEQTRVHASSQGRLLSAQLMGDEPLMSQVVLLDSDDQSVSGNASKGKSDTPVIHAVRGIKKGINKGMKKGMKKSQPGNAEAGPVNDSKAGKAHKECSNQGSNDLSIDLTGDCTGSGTGGSRSDRENELTSRLAAETQQFSLVF
ncbi:MAG: hypothetical protein KDI36_09010 [Pseudomonadales bacterium]|nr:hypothetical protein [Pseudomonadales bacterium]